MKKYMDTSLSSRERAKLLLSEMAIEEKLWQLSGDMIYSVEADYDDKRDPRHGHFRNPGHFMHHTLPRPAGAAEVARQINSDVKKSIEASPHGIPPMENGEALHGAQWGMATCFPQPIALASSFDDSLMDEVADVIGKECAAVGVHQVFAPVVNITRDCRWGRTVESYGEDVLLSSNMGAAMCKGLEKNKVVATPKHYVDNYADGGRDSNYSHSSERTLREVYLKPFEKCFKEGGAQSVMAAYTAWDGVPCSCSKKLMTDILRDEWGFDGFGVSDYGGMQGVCGSHRLTDANYKAQAMCIKAGLEINLPASTIDDLRRCYEEGLLTEGDIDRAVENVLKVKFEVGLFDHPYADPEAAEKMVRCEKHKALALKAARQSIILLKNDGVLPLKKDAMKKIGVFGSSAKVLPVGLNYSGAYMAPWTADDAMTPLEYLEKYFAGKAEVVFMEDSEIAEKAPLCDACLYFTTIVEGEGMDRCDIHLPKLSHKAKQEDENAIIVGKIEIEIREDQDAAIKQLTKANANSVIMLMNGAPVDMSQWIDGARAVIEVWYPGEQGAQAMAEILFGEVNPSAKLPITIPRSVGQLPLFYSYKPSGRGYGYNDNDGTPLYAFGHGLSYTTFEYSDISPEVAGDTMKIGLTVKNTGEHDGAEIIQAYISGRNCPVVRPLMELKGYARAEVKKGESLRTEVTLDKEAFFYYDQNLNFAMHDGDYTIMIGSASDRISHTFEVRVRGGRIEYEDA